MERERVGIKFIIYLLPATARGKEIDYGVGEEVIRCEINVYRFSASGRCIQLIGSWFNRFCRSPWGVSMEWSETKGSCLEKYSLVDAREFSCGCLCCSAHVARSGWFFCPHRVSGSTWHSEQHLPLSGVHLCRTWVLMDRYRQALHWAPEPAEPVLFHGKTKLCKEGWKRHLETCRRVFS